MTPTAPGADLRERVGVIDPLDWRAIEPLYARLERETPAPEEVPAWIGRWSDVKMVVWEGWSTVKGRQERDLTDAAAQAALQSFIEGVLGPSEVADGKLAVKLLAVPDWRPEPQHEQMMRRFRSAADVRTGENADLNAEISALVAEYGRIGATISVVVGGRTLTGPELEAAARHPDRGRREGAWRAQAQAWLEQREALDDLFIVLLEQRRRQARRAGLANYRALYWREVGRVDYTPEDCIAFHEAVAAEVVPLAARRQRARRAALGVDALRPWDLEVDQWGVDQQGVDPRAVPPARLFPDLAAFEEGMAGVFGRV
ncbi:MAG: M3 family metallopeptidase, partial [Chloroflexota bacterium]|nr:M3 family metallopeptidase [Chloroflexota bacterium]